MVGSVDSCPDISEARWAMLVVAYDNISDRITASMCPGLKQAMHEVEFSESGRSFKRAWDPKTTEVGVNALAAMCALEDQVTMCIGNTLESNKYNKIRSAILNSLKCKQIFDLLTWKSECRILQHLSRVADHVHEDPDALSSAALDALCATMSDLASEVERVMSKQGDANCYISNIKTFVESWKSTLVGPSKARFGELLLPNMDPEKLLVSLDVEELREIQPCKHRIVERMESYAVLSGGLSLGETFDVPFAQWSLCLNNTRIEVAQAFVAAIISMTVLFYQRRSRMQCVPFKLPTRRSRASKVGSQKDWALSRERLGTQRWQVLVKNVLRSSKLTLPIVAKQIYSASSQRVSRKYKVMGLRRFTA